MMRETSSAQSGVADGGSGRGASLAGLPEDRAECAFHDFKHGLTDVEAKVEAGRCIYCYDAPCIQACPTGINIPQFIQRIGSGDVLGSAKTILDSNILGLSCARSCPVETLCEGACVYNHLNKKPISIGKLQRFAVETAYDEGAEFYEPGKPSGKRVALVGAGPASLACAHELRKLGHEAVIYEKENVAGGLNTSGIAPYKMKADVSLREITEVQKLGAKIEYGKAMGRDVTIDGLLAEFDAVFLGMGLGPDSRMGVPGEDLPEVRGAHGALFGAVEFIGRLKKDPADKFAWLKNVKAALVVGGGNTALDACRELKGLGVPRVVVSYRRGEAEMSGYRHETQWAKQEGVEFWFHTVPVEYRRGESATSGAETGRRREAQSAKWHQGETSGGDSVALRARIQKTRVEGGKVVPVNEFVDLDVGLVLVATGQAKLEKLLSGVKGLAFEKGRLITDAKTGCTGHPRIFAGGDLANGGMEVVNAVAEGKRAALGIHEILGGVRPEGRGRELR